MKIETKQTIGIRIKAARNAHKFSQPVLAEKVGRSKDTISNLERGITAPTLETLERISTVLNIPLSEFFKERGGTGINKKRLELEVEIHELLKQLTMADLKIAQKQVMVLVNRDD